MPGQIIDGRKIASEIQEELKQRVSKLKEKGTTPGLVAILVGEDPASLSYLRGIAKGCEAVGIFTDTVKLPEGITQAELEKKQLMVVEHCIKFGYTFSPRLHVWLWGDKRKV